MLNSDEVLDAAKATAERIRAQTPNRSDQVRLAYGLILNRHPQEREVKMASAFIETSDDRNRAGSPALAAPGDSGDAKGRPVSPPSTGLQELCRALFNLNAFVYAD